jgi:hypothetical protein
MDMAANDILSLPRQREPCVKAARVVVGQSSPMKTSVLDQDDVAGADKHGEGSPGSGSASRHAGSSP